MANKGATKQTYYVNNLRDNEWQQVAGEPVSFPGFDGFDFFLYKKPDGRYAVAEARTGLSVGLCTSGSRRASKGLAEEELVRHGGPVAVRARLDAMVERCGLSPRYREAENNAD